jgi:hypothetical protein
LEHLDRLPARSTGAVSKASDLVVLVKVADFGD